MDSSEKKDSVTPSSTEVVNTNVGSMLEQILEEAKKTESTPGIDSSVSTSIVGNNDNIEGTKDLGGKIDKKREPVSPLLILKFLGTLFLIALIFFGSFLAYIVFNPAQAQFFGNFGIDLNDVALLLRKLVNGIFGLIVFVTSILWIFLLFRAIWTSKELKRQRLLRWLVSGFVGIILFSLITLWAVLIQTINATDYSGGNVILYDQELGIQSDGKHNPLLSKTTGLIGPIRILFDISANAKTAEREKGIRIESYKIDFDGAKCGDGKSTLGGTDTNDKSIVCLFDKVKTFNPTGVYISRDRSGNPVETRMNLPTIEIRGIVDIKKGRDINNKPIVTLNAQKLQNIGNPTWFYDNGTQEKGSVTITQGENPQYICLKVLSNECRWFVIAPSLNQENIGVITATEDPGNPLLYSFDLQKLTVDENKIIGIDWLLDDKTIICSNEKNCNYTFLNYGKKTISAKITLASNEEYILEYTLDLQEPLKLIRGVKVYNEAGALVNTNQTYEPTLKAFIIKDVSIPSTLKLDARDVVTTQPGYTLDSVEWKIIGKKPPPEKKVGDTLDLQILESARYSVYITYTFSYIQGQNVKKSTSQELVIVDTESRNLIPILSVTQSSDYAPVVVNVDASASKSSNGEIIKFIYDFGEGKELVEGDSQQEYEYLEAGDRDITLTVVNSSGEKASIVKRVIIKKPQRIVNFSPSISPGVAGSEIDFTPIDVNGQISDYIWNFGDGTEVVRTMNPSHSFKNPGKYTVSLTVRYSDGTQKTETKEYVVESSLIN